MSIALASNAVTIEDFNNISKDIENICKSYNKVCNINCIDKESKRAYSLPTEIYIHKGLIDILDRDELQAVMLHEVGHIVLNHHKRYFSFNWNNYPVSYKSLKTFNHSQEYEADLFATYYQLNNKKLNYLPSALKKIMPAGYENYETITHPSYTKRIINMTTNRSLNKYEM